MPKLRVLIVDDERPARQKIRQYLGDEDDVQIIGEAGNGREAVKIIESLKPDLVFLDVQMPGLDGFGVIESLAAQRLPQIVFVTAYDQFALRAFEVHALDYLLKPFDAARFQMALERARAHILRLNDDHVGERVLKLLKEMGGGIRYLERLLINENGRAFFLQVNLIDRVASEKNYVRLHVGKESYVLRGTVEGLSKRLDPSKFARVNRSQIINLDFIKELQPWFHGEYRIVLKDGTEISWSRRYIDRESELFTNRF